MQMFSVFRPASSPGVLATVAMLLLFGWLLPATLYAETDKKEAEDGPPEPEELELRSSDGLKLFATYYPGTKGKKSVPVVILHNLKESGEDYASLALFLQGKGHAVVVPDLRGHGQSTQIFRANRKPVPVKMNRPSPRQVKKMVIDDMSPIRTFLLQENNEGRLNINKLCLVGSGFGALVAMNYAVEDWSWEDLAYQKQGKDVKALVLISPEWSFGKNLSASTFIDNPRVRGRLSLLLMVGREKKKTFKNSEKIHTRLSKFYPEPEEKEAAKAKALFFVKRDTVFQSEKLVNTPEFNCPKTIAGFIQVRLVAKKFPWEDRSAP